MSTNGNYRSPNHSTFDKDSGKVSEWRSPNPSKLDKKSEMAKNPNPSTFDKRKLHKIKPFNFL